MWDGKVRWFIVDMLSMYISDLNWCVLFFTFDSFVFTECKEEADKLFEDVLHRKDRADGTRNALNVLHRFRFLLYLPVNIERHIQKGDYDVVINDYARAKSLFSDTQVPVSCYLTFLPTFPVLCVLKLIPFIVSLHCPVESEVRLHFPYTVQGTLWKSEPLIIGIFSKSEPKKKSEIPSQKNWKTSYFLKNVLTLHRNFPKN